MSLAASIINLSEFLAASAALTDDSEALTHESAALADCDALTAASSTADLTYDDSDSDDDDDTATAALEIADLAFNANSAAFEADSEEFGAALTLSDFMYTWLAFCAALSLRRPDQLYKSERNKRMKQWTFWNSGLGFEKRFFIYLTSESMPRKKLRSSFSLLIFSKIYDSIDAK